MSSSKRKKSRSTGRYVSVNEEKTVTNKSKKRYKITIDKKLNEYFHDFSPRRID